MEDQLIVESVGDGVNGDVNWSVRLGASVTLLYGEDSGRVHGHYLILTMFTAVHDVSWLYPVHLCARN